MFCQFTFVDQINVFGLLMCLRYYISLYLYDECILYLCDDLYLYVDVAIDVNILFYVISYILTCLVLLYHI